MSLRVKVDVDRISIEIEKCVAYQNSSNMGSNGHPNGVLLESRRIFSV